MRHELGDFLFELVLVIQVASFAYLVLGVLFGHLFERHPPVDEEREAARRERHLASMGVIVEPRRRRRDPWLDRSAALIAAAIPLAVVAWLIVSAS
jgi:hypothetical protein